MPQTKKESKTLYMQGQVLGRGMTDIKKDTPRYKRLMRILYRKMGKQ